MKKTLAGLLAASLLLYSLGLPTSALFFKSPERLVCGRSLEETGFGPPRYSEPAEPRPCNGSKLVAIGVDDPMGGLNNRIRTVFSSLVHAWDLNKTLVLGTNWGLPALFGYDLTPFQRSLCVKKEFHLAKREKLAMRPLFYFDMLPDKARLASSRMRLLFGLLFGNPKPKICHAVREVVGRINGGFTTVHHRWFEGRCKEVLADEWLDFARRKPLRHRSEAFSVESCFMRPRFLRKILERLGIRRDRPVVLIHDGQHRQWLDAMKSSGELSRVVIPRPGSTQRDMMLGILATTFIGTPGSAMTCNIVHARDALGAPRDSSIVAVWDKPRTSGEEFVSADPCFV